MLGCGPKGARLPETGATLEGTTTYGSDAVSSAQVTAFGEGGMAVGTVGDDGRYRIENVPLGEVRIVVNTQSEKGNQVARSMAGGTFQGSGAKGRGKGTGVPKFVDVPAKYADAESSGLKTTINNGPNTYDIKIPR